MTQNIPFLNNAERSDAGYFAPSFPLEMGENVFNIRHEDEELELTVIRNSSEPG